jgi:hypothetical protein
MARRNQQALDFRVAPLPTLPVTLAPRETSPKRPRVTTGTATAQPTLPPNRRPRTAARWRAPALKSTQSYIFRGLHPLYTRHVMEERHDKITIKCTQDGCSFEKVIDRTLHGTNNYKTHYRKHHTGIPISESEEKELLRQRATKAGTQPTLLEMPVSHQTYNERYRVLLLKFIIKNNLSFRIVNQLETRKLFSFLSPVTKQISRRILIRDLKI